MGRGTKFQVRVAPWIGSGGYYRLPVHIIQHLRTIVIYILHQIIDLNMITIWHQEWLLVRDLVLKEEYEPMWDAYVVNLKSNYI